MQQPLLKDMRLVDGTSLALQFGHRRSVDLDFFGSTTEDILLKHYSFDDIIKFYLQKYTDGSEYRALLSMTYFADADPQPMPYMFQKVDWETIKIEIKHQVELFNRKKLQTEV